jgi:transketolase
MLLVSQWPKKRCARNLAKKIVNHNTYVIAGDGCLMEGVSQEAISLAGRHELGKLIVLWDNNNITIDGTVDMADSTNQVMRFKASGWHVLEIDGHDPDAIDLAITAAKKSKKPTMIACETHIALGSSAQDTSKGHGALTDPKLIEDARKTYGWVAKSFDIPQSLKTDWETIGKKGIPERDAWAQRLKGVSQNRKNEFERVYTLEPAKKIKAAVRNLKEQISSTTPIVATRKSSEMALNVINPIAPETFGGSADLSGSNNTKSAEMSVFDTDNRSGRYIHWGVREHGMAAAMNGMVLHGGIRAYGGTFMCFTDYARPAMRLAALMKVPTVFVMTHDSIGLGEDGPTHQPVEHLAISRATPNTYVFRPADTIETAEAWEVALTTKTTPSVMALSRQGLPTVRVEHKPANLSQKGAYILQEADGNRQAILIATGSEVSLAIEARKILQQKGIGTRVISMPCMELFAEQEESYRKRVLPGGSTVRIGIEAGVRQGWDRWLLGERGREAKSDFIGMNGFGASAPAEILFEHFGITAKAVVERVESLLEK